MKKLMKRQRLRLENKTANLSDLFAQIARSLPNATVSSNGEGDTYSLSQELLKVDYKIQHCFPAEKTERLVISQEWSHPKCVERITIQDAYDDLKNWIVKEVVDYLSLINSDSKRCVDKLREIATSNGVTVFEADNFALDLAGMYYELRESKLDYFTDSISRGLQSLATLRMPEHVDWQTSSGEARVRRIFKSMLHDELVENELNRQLGRVGGKVIDDYLRAGKLRLDKEFTFSEKDSCSKWQDMTFELIWLCKYYAGIDMPKGLHDNV